MSSNKAAKEALIRLYGPECFIEKLHLRDSKEERHYTGKNQYKRMKMLTYHHIKMKSKGGKATVENGALLSAENHAWFHQQSKEDQERMNNAFQEYKREVDHGTYTKAKIEFVDDIDLPFEIKTTEVVFGEKDLQKETSAERKIERRKRRRKEKKELQRLREEWEDR